MELMDLNLGKNIAVMVSLWVAIRLVQEWRWSRRQLLGPWTHAGNPAESLREMHTESPAIAESEPEAILPNGLSTAPQFPSTPE